MAARPGALACQAQLYGALTDWFLARRDVREEEKWREEGREEKGERWGGEAWLMMRIQWGERESRASQLGSGDEEEMIWHTNGNEKAATVLPDDTEATEFVIYLVSGS